MARVMAFGEVMMRFSIPDNKKLFQVRNLEYSFSGTGVNVLSGLAHFGHQGKLLSRLPKNMVGEAAKSFVSSLGIDTSFISWGGEYMGMYFLESGFGDRASKVTYTNRLESSFCTSSFIDYDIENALENIDLIHFCGISLGVTENVRNTIFKIAEKAKEKGVLIAFDCNFRSTLWKDYLEARPYYEKMLQLSDIVFLTERDGKSILGLSSEKVSEEEERFDIFTQISKKYNLKFIAGTKREIISNNLHEIQGFIYSDNKIYYTEKRKFEVLDRIGGGDGFVSGILHGFLSGFSFEKTVEFGVASGILAHMTYGDSPISSVSDVENILGKTKDIIR